MKTRKLTLAQRERRNGWLFVTPFLVGFVFFFLSPLVTTVVYSLNKITVGVGGIQMNFVGLENFRQALFVDATFLPTFWKSCQNSLINSVGIVVFSLLMAVLLNGEFRGRTLVRAIMFLPVIISSGVAADGQYNSLSNLITNYMNSADSTLVTEVTDFLSSSFSVTGSLLGYVKSMVSGVNTIIRASGVQILFYLAGLQTISPSLYEASTVEGATGWENFWKITLPMISPYILVNVVYTIVDQTGTYSNSVIKLIASTINELRDYGLASVFGWFHILFIAIVLTASVFVISRFVFYYD